MPTQLARNRVEARPGLPLPNGLINAAALLPMDDVHDENGVDWFSLGCGPASVAFDCIDDADVTDLAPYYPQLVASPEVLDKTFDSPDHLTAPSVTVYKGVECSAPGWDYQEAIERALNGLNMGEQAALELWTWAQMMPTASVVTSDGDPGVVGALAELEAALAQVYAGVGIVHIPSVLASYVMTSGLVYKDGTKWRTLSGHLVSIGAGYPGSDENGDDPASTEAWMMISGQVTIRQAQIQETPGSDRRGAVTIKTNDRVVLAERTSVVQIECGAFAAKATKSCCGSPLGS